MKKLLVTDPCYLISDEEWAGMCNACFKAGEEDNGIKKFAQQVQDLLRIISGDQKAVADDTGIGDWVNKIDGQMFYADSGMVCVVEDTEKLRGYLDKYKIILPLGVARVEVEDDAMYKIDRKDPTWSVVEILDSKRLLRSDE